MNSRVEVEGGICGLKTVVQAKGDEMSNVAFSIESQCAKVQVFGEALKARGPVDGYNEIGEGSEGVILTTARATLKGCCAACLSPIAAFKAMQVAAGLALPKDVSLKISSEQNA